MILLLLLFFGGTVVVGTATALLLSRAARSVPSLHRLRDGLRALLGRAPAALAVLLAGLAATFIVGVLLGKLAKAVEPAVDHPMFRWSQDSAHAGWVSVNRVLTLMGNRPEIKLVCAVSAVVLAVLWRRRAWWLPPLAIAVAFVTEKYGQSYLALVVHRGHPPTTMGTYPSGGCGRLISIYGLIYFLVLLTAPRLPRAWRIAGWSVLAVAGYVEGYTRTYLLKHWFTDVVGGWVYGGLLLLVLVAATATLVARVPASPAEALAADADRERVPAVTG